MLARTKARSLADPVTVGSVPTGIAASNTRAYVANSGSGTISVLDLAQSPAAVIATVRVGSYPFGVALSSDGSQVYVTNFDSNTLSIISTATNTVTGTVRVGSHPDGVVVVGGSVYVSNLTSASISVVDPSTATVTGTISLTGTLAPEPSGLASNTSGSQLYVDDVHNNTTIVVDLTPPAQVGSVGVGKYPAYLSVAGTTPTGWVANPGSNSVSVLNLGGNPPTVSNTIGTDAADYGVLAMPSLNQTLVTSSSANLVDLINPNGLVETQAFTVGTTPDAIALTPDNTKVLVTNEGSNNVTIDPTPPSVGSVSYTGAVGNTPFGVGTTPSQPSVQTTGSVLSNSTDPNGLSMTAGPASITTAQGGHVSMNSDGSFTYDPPVGFTGTDTFDFAVSNGTTQSTGQASIGVQNRVWYVNDSAGTNGNGTSTSPFNTLASVTGPGGPTASGDYIFLYGSSSSYSGGISLKSSQTLVGQSYGLTIGGQTVVSASGSNPTVTNSGGTGITVANGDQVDGVTVSGTSGVGVAATGVNAFTLDSSDTISATTGNGLDINGGSGTIDDGATIDTSAAHSLSVQNRTGGTVDVAGPITDDGDGIVVNSNTGAAVAFSGKITASTGANTAFTATGGGTVTAVGSGSTLTTSTATAVNVASTTIGSSGLSFQSVSSNGAVNGIKLSSTGTSGGLSVTGTGTTAGSGGTIQSSTGAGVSLSSTTSPSLTDMDIENNATAGVSGSSVNGFTLAGSTVSGNGTYASISDYNQDGLDFTGGLTGTATISNSTVTHSADSGLQVTDSSGSLNLTVTGSTFSNEGSSVPGASDPLLGDGVEVLSDGSTSATVSVTGSTFTSNTGYQFAFQPAALAAASGTNSVTFDNNTLSNSTGAGNGGGVFIAGDGTSTTTLDVKGNTITGASRDGIALYNDGTTHLSGTVSGNTIGKPAVLCSGSVGGSDIAPTTRGSATSTLAIENNNLYQYNNPAGINAINDEGSGVMNLTITGNTIADPVNATQTCPTQGGPSGALWGLVVYAGGQSTDTSTTCADITGNSMTGSSPSPADGGIDDFEFDEYGTGTFKLPAYTGGSADSLAVVSYVQANNTSGGSPSGDTYLIGTGSSGGYFFDTTSCPTPAT